MVEFAINGTSFPHLPFDIGESYGGLLPISADATDTQQLYFWFFPSDNPRADDEIVVWLNGGVSTSPNWEPLPLLISLTGPASLDAPVSLDCWQRMASFCGSPGRLNLS